MPDFELWQACGHERRYLVPVPSPTGVYELLSLVPVIIVRLDNIGQHLCYNLAELTDMSVYLV